MVNESFLPDAGSRPRKASPPGQGRDAGSRIGVAARGTAAAHTRGAAQASTRRARARAKRHGRGGAGGRSTMGSGGERAQQGRACAGYFGTLSTSLNDL